MAALDFFTVEVLTLAGIIRYYVLFVIRLKTREVQIVGITAQPCEKWMKQPARNLIDTFDGFLRDACCTTLDISLDRDPLYTVCFRRLLRDSGTNPVRLPARSPNLNTFAERFILSAARPWPGAPGRTPRIKSECLNKSIPLGEKHLRLAIKECMEHYHAERNHQGLGSRIIYVEENVGSGDGVIKTRSRLGGFLNYYYRKAA